MGINGCPTGVHPEKKFWTLGWCGSKRVLWKIFVNWWRDEDDVCLGGFQTPRWPLEQFWTRLALWVYSAQGQLNWTELLLKPTPFNVSTDFGLKDRGCYFEVWQQYFEVGTGVNYRAHWCSTYWFHALTWFVLLHHFSCHSWRWSRALCKRVGCVVKVPMHSLGKFAISTFHIIEI